MEKGVAGAVSSGPPTYIYLLRLTLLLPSSGVPLARPLLILFPSFPSDIRGLPPLPSLFQPSLSLPPPPPPSPPTALPPSLPHLPPAQPLAHPSRLTYLNPLSSVSSRRHPFLNPDTLPPPFSTASVSRRLTSAPSFSRPLPRNAPADKQTADTSQFYAIVSFFICSLVFTLIQILLHMRGGEDPLARKYLVINNRL